jgi:ankyrin repeat protein
MPIQRYTSPLNKRLFKAIHAGDAAVVEKLLNEGADANANSNGDFRPLHSATFGRAGAKIIKLLLARKPNLDVETEHGQTPLNFAIGQGELDIVKLLVEAGASINGPENPRASTPLLHALDSKGCYARDDDAIAIYLLSKGADMTATKDGHTTMFQGTLWRHYDAVSEMLARGASIDMRDPTGLTPLMKAVEWESVDAVRFLIDAGADPNAVHNGETVLGKALSHREWEKIIPMLFQGGADIDLPENEKVRRVAGNEKLRGVFSDTARLRREYLEARFSAFTEGSGAAVAVKKPLRLQKPLT